MELLYNGLRLRIRRIGGQVKNFIRLHTSWPESQGRREGYCFKLEQTWLQRNTNNPPRQVWVQHQICVKLWLQVITSAFTPPFSLLSAFRTREFAIDCFLALRFRKIPKDSNVCRDEIHNHPAGRKLALITNWPVIITYFLPVPCTLLQLEQDNQLE